MTQTIVQDLRIGIRSLLRVPLLTLTIVATVGVGIGATAAIFSAIDAAMLRPLPYAHPDRLVRIYTDTPPFKFRFSAADYLAFTEQQTRFERHATYTDRSVSFSNGEVAELLRTRVVSWAVLFGARRSAPCRAAISTRADGRVGAPVVALASQRSGNSVLAAAPTPSASLFASTATTCTIVGVMPPAAGPLERRQDLFLIQQFTPPTRKGPFFYSVVARLPEGADRGLAAGELRAHQSRPVPDLEVVLPGRKVHVEHGGSQDEPRRRRARDRRPFARAPSLSSG